MYVCTYCFTGDHKKSKFCVQLIERQSFIETQKGESEQLALNKSFLEPRLKTKSNTGHTKPRYIEAPVVR